MQAAPGEVSVAVKSGHLAVATGGGSLLACRVHLPVLRQRGFSYLSRHRHQIAESWPGALLPKAGSRPLHRGGSPRLPAGVTGHLVRYAHATEGIAACQHSLPVLVSSRRPWPAGTSLLLAARTCKLSLLAPRCAPHALSPALSALHAHRLLAGVAACGLEPLLEGAGLQVLVAHVLPQLSLHELGRLATVCRRLRTAVITAPEALWQGTARVSLPHPQHPVHRAASCRAYLCQQHTVHAALRSGRGAHVTHQLRQPGALAPNLSTYAVLVRIGRASHILVLRELASRRELQRFQLPAQEFLGWHFFSHGVYWDSESRRCALPWGRAWLDSQDYAGSAGLCIVDTQTGGTALIPLGNQAFWLACTGFTPGGLLVVRHTTRRGRIWKAFDADGAAQSKMRSICDDTNMDGERLALAPSGDQAVLYLGGVGEGSDFFQLWCLLTGTAWRVRLAEGAKLKEIIFSPCATQLLCLTRFSALVMDLQGTVLASTDLPSCPSHAAWSGDLVAITCRPDDEWESQCIHATQMRVFTVQSASLMACAVARLANPTGEHELWHFLGTPVFSPSWQHIAVPACKFSPMEDKVMLFTADCTLCMDIAGPELSLGTLRWSESGSAVACSRSSRESLLVDVVSFA